MPFRLAEAYVEISARGAAAVERDLARVEKGFYSTAKASLLGGKSIGKFFLMGLGIGTAEQIINRIANAISGMVRKMDEAVEKGEALGNGIARWAAETLHVDNAVAKLDRRTARELRGQQNMGSVEDVINEGLRSKGLRGEDNFGGKQLAAIDSEMSALRALRERELQKQDRGGFFGQKIGDGTTSVDLEIASKAQQRKDAAKRLDQTEKIMDEFDRMQRNKPQFTSLEEFGRKVALSAVKDPATMLDEERNKLLEEIAKRLGFTPPAP